MLIKNTRFQRKIATLLFSLFSLMVMAQNENPFFGEWTTPFKVPPFQEIRNEHFLPAFNRGIEFQKQEIEEITANPGPATFENTIEALDRSGTMLRSVSAVFYGLNGANTNAEMQQIARELSPLTTAHTDDINLNPDLFARIKTVYDHRDKLRLDPVQLRLLTETYKNFIRAGAALDPDKQERLRQVNKEIDMQQLTFSQNLLAETNDYKLVISDQENLAGLPEQVILAAQETAGKDPETKGSWVFTLQNPSIVPFLQYSAKRDFREQIMHAYHNRCNNDNDKDNKAVIRQLVTLRAEKAALLGYASFGDYAIENRMAAKPARVYQLLDEIWAPAIQAAVYERSEMQKIMDEEGQGFRLQDYDWPYYSEKWRNTLYSLDEEKLKPYFPLENVLKGIFYVANRLYGITFTEVPDCPKYDQDVILYECKDADGSHLGVLYFDFFPRKGKRGGAWCGTYRAQGYSGKKRIAPVVTIVTNFSPPAGGKPALLSSDEVETLFHEFGHALHNLMKNVRYNSLSAVPRDFVELPSQIMEHWAFEPEVLSVYAIDYQTKKVLPVDLVGMIKKSKTYGQGFKTTEYLAACYLDMAYHTGMSDDPAAKNRAGAVAAVIEEPINPLSDELDVNEFEKKTMERIGLIPEIAPRYRSTYFQHSMSGGYTAGYYSYIWSEVLDADAFKAFLEKGNIFDKETATRFRKYILEPGGSRDAAQMYLDFRGHEPGIDPLLENRGLKK